MRRSNALISLALAVISGGVSAQEVTSREAFAALSGGGPVVNCTVKPLREVALASPAPGIVAQVHARPGQRVRTGDLLVELDTRVLQSELALAEARAQDRTRLNAAVVRRDGAKIKEARLAQARARKAVAASEHDAAALELGLAEAEIARETQALALAALEVQRAQAVLDSMQLRSPVDGILGENLIDPGESASGEPLATIYVNQPLRVEAFVPAALLASFVEQDAFSVVINGATDAPLAVTLDHISPVADLASNTISAFFRLENNMVLPGSKCAMNVLGGTE
jgi:RND family efflux transporter MFP subunit